MDEDTVRDKNKKALGEFLIIIFLLAIGFMRLLPQILMVYSAPERFLNEPFPEVIPLIFSLLYMISGIIAILSTKTGFLMAVPVIAFQFMVDCYVSILKEGIGIIPLLLIVYSLDILALIYIVYAMMKRRIH